MYKSLEKTADAGKVRQQELAKKVAALRADLTQAREQIVSKVFILTEKEADLANKKRELAARATEITRNNRSSTGSVESTIRLK